MKFKGNSIKRAALIMITLTMAGCSSLRQAKIGNKVDVKDDKSIAIELGNSTMTDMLITKLSKKGYTVVEPDNRGDVHTRFVLKDNIKWNEKIIFPNRHWGNLSIIDNHDNKAVATITVNNKWKWRATNRLVRQFERNTY